jgi:hypothetical protein
VVVVPAMGTAKRETRNSTGTTEKSDQPKGGQTR